MKNILDIKLDRYNVAILNTLQRQGRLSKRALAEKIGLSVSPCWVRLKKLEQTGYIRGYEAKVELNRIARFCHVTTLIGLNAHQAHDLRKFENAVNEISEITRCDAVAGEIDYILHFVTVDIDHYQRLVEQLLEADVGIRVYFSHVRSKQIKNDHSDLLDALLHEMDARQSTIL